MRLKFVGGSFAVYVVMAACAGRAPTPEVGSYAPPAVGGGASGGMPSGAGGLPGIGGMVAQPGEMTGGAQMGASEKPTLELWDRALRWLERLRALSNRPLYDADFDFAVAWDVSDHALAVLGCCDSMRDWLRNSDKSLADAVTQLSASANLRACRDVVNTAKHLWIHDRHYAVAPLSEAIIRMIGEERERRGETVMWPEEFQTITEPLISVHGRPARLLVSFHGKNAPPFDLLSASTEKR